MMMMLCGTASGASVTSNYDPYHMYQYYVEDNADNTAAIYNRYGNSDIGFFYQLRDITGSARSEQVAGPQWFATIYENYYRYFHELNENTTGNNRNAVAPARMYRRTLGGEMSDIPFSVLGDILNGFNFVLAEEPQPYELWTNYDVWPTFPTVNTRSYDVYPDPIESVCIVITDGMGDMSIKFGNPYARHFPFWWGWGYNTNLNRTGKLWWQNYNWTDYVYVDAEPIDYIFTPADGKIYQRSTDNQHTEKYRLVVSVDNVPASRTPTAYTLTTSAVDGRIYYSLWSDSLADPDTISWCYQIRDASGNAVYNISSDIYGFHAYDMDENLAFTISGDRIFDASGALKWTIEQNSSNELFIVAARNIAESVEFSGFDDYTFTPANQEDENVFPGTYMNAQYRIRGASNYDYGSKRGYIAFKQRATFANGYSNYREAAPIPLVIANVSNGNASDNPLLFDMFVFDSTGRIVNRIKFNWNAQTDLLTQNLGTFFMMQPYNSSMPTYYIETHITNRTGTRYQLFRYDQYGRTSPDVTYRDDYASIRPAYWKYDITPDLYGTLPDTFMLDAHSQIAPGLVTVYRSNVYGTMNMNYDTSESFRLYEYSSTNPKNLRLNYTRVAGMTTAGTASFSDNSVSTQGFNMQFSDVIRNDEETEYELTQLMGQAPKLVSGEDSIVVPSQIYIGSSALNAFAIDKEVPLVLQAIVGYSDDYVPEAPSEPSTPETPETPDTPETPETPENNENAAAMYAAELFTTDGIAIQPVKIRLRIPRQNSLLQSHWEELENAQTSTELFNKFAGFGTIWVRSGATREYDANLLTAINNKGSRIGVSAADCFSAFTYEDELYLDFIVFLADAVSLNTGKTAFVEIFRDDGVPYILIGDGAIDKKWNLQFYVGAAGADPEVTRPDDDSTTNNSTTSNSGSSTETAADVSGSGGGGGCNFGLLGMFGVMLLALKLKR